MPPAEPLWARMFHDFRATRLRQQHRRHAARGELEAYMGPVEWSQLRATVEALAPRVVVEWGAGGGTRALLEACSSVERYISIEHDRGWFERVRDAVRDDRLSLHHVAPNLPEPVRDLQQRATRERYEAWVAACERDADAMRDYVALPARSIDAADLVLVDGRARCFCIAEGYRLLRPGGVLLLHDAQRPEYRPALSRLGDAVFLTPWELGQLALLRKPAPRDAALMGRSQKDVDRGGSTHGDPRDGQPAQGEPAHGRPAHGEPAHGEPGAPRSVALAGAAAGVARSPGS